MCFLKWKLSSRPPGPWQSLQIPYRSIPRLSSYKGGTNFFHVEEQSSPVGSWMNLTKTKLEMLWQRSVLMAHVNPRKGAYWVCASHSTEARGIYLCTSFNNLSLHRRRFKQDILPSAARKQAGLDLHSSQDQQSAAPQSHKNHLRQ